MYQAICKTFYTMIAEGDRDYVMDFCRRNCIPRKCFTLKKVK